MDLKIVFPLVLLTILVLNGGNYFVEGQEHIIIYKCDIDSCTKLCQQNWGPKLIRAFCKHTKDGELCICEHESTMIHKGSRKNLLM